MISWFNKLFGCKKLVNLKFGIKNDEYHEEVIRIEDLEKRLDELNNIYFPIKNPDEVESIWCLVGNAVDEHYYGEKREIRRGTKHFPPGAKLYCFPTKWGDGYENIIVIGRPRKTKRFITVVINSKLVTNWRIQRVYTPFIKAQMLENRGWDDSDESKEIIEKMLKWLPNKTATI